jgi:hypothetical protein
MIHLDPSLMLDSTTMWILIVVVILVFSLHLYLQRFMGKRSPAGPVPASGSSAARNATPVADERRANVKR